jgi:hypothetical protein
MPQSVDRAVNAEAAESTRTTSRIRSCNRTDAGDLRRVLRWTPAKAARSCRSMCRSSATRFAEIMGRSGSRTRSAKSMASTWGMEQHRLCSCTLYANNATWSYPKRSPPGADDAEAARLDRRAAKEHALSARSPSLQIGRTKGPPNRRAFSRRGGAYAARPRQVSIQSRRRNAQATRDIRHRDVRTRQ